MMTNLPNNLSGLIAYHQFIVVALNRNGATGKFEKRPIHYQTGQITNALDSTAWTDCQTAIASTQAFSERFNAHYTVGFVFTENDPFFFLDIDHCLQADNTWSAMAIKLCDIFQGAAVEISSSNQGLHIFGRYAGTMLPHGCKNTQHHLEFYTDKRFVALTGTNMVGDINTDFTATLREVIPQYFPKNGTLLPREAITKVDILAATEDELLLKKALKSQSIPGKLGRESVQFSDLWHANETVLAIKYPASGRQDGKTYDASSTDAALAQHLAFWTRKNPVQIKRLMHLSQLYREKYDRLDYLDRTIQKACARQIEVYQGGVQSKDNAIAQPSKPEPLPELPPVMPFDYDYLPDSLRDYVQDISERMQCPPDFSAVAAFVMIATLCGRKIALRPMKNNDWTVIPNLWSAVVGNSGVMKSPTLHETLSPIKKLAVKASESFQKETEEYIAQQELVKLQQSVNKSEARKALKGKSVTDAKMLLNNCELDEKLILQRYITNNSSYEALGEILIENPNGLLVESDEMIGLLKQLDAKGQEVARSFYLTAADGDKPYTFDRIMRGKGLQIDAVCLSIIGGIQPGVLAEYVRDAVNGGAGADGLLQRFGLIVYPDIPTQWTEVDRYPNREARKKVASLVERLNSMHAQSVIAETDIYGGVPFLRFDQAAQSLFSHWRSELEHRLRSGDEHPAMISHLSKYRKLVPSLALLNHLCDVGYGPVNETALQRAINFSHYLESHAQRIYSFAIRPDIDAAKTILKRLSDGKLKNPFTAREVYKKGWAGLGIPEKAKDAIQLLLEYGHLIEEKQLTDGRPTEYYYWVNCLKE